MSKVTDGSYGSLGTPVGADGYVAVQASGPAVKIGTHSALRDFTNMAQATGTDADTTMAVNTLYVVDMSAWATADRTYTLPATAAVGDQIAIAISAGDASHKLLITAGTGDTLGGVAGGTTWGNLFVTGESVLMRCVAANSTWVVMQDGRAKPAALTRIANDGVATQTFGTTNTKIAAILTTVSANPYTWWDTTTKRFTPKRAGYYLCFGALQNSSTSAQLQTNIYKNGAAEIAGLFQGAATYVVSTVAGVAYCNGTSDYLELYGYQSTSGVVGAAAPNNFVSFLYLGP